MNTRPTFDGIDPFADPVDRLLAEIAFALQLPPSLHRQAVARYEAVRRYLERTPAFADLVEHFYPQGSMAIDATIATRGTDDEYDLDLIAQLGGRFRHLPPLAILLELEAALKDYPVQAVTRQTRCVTLQYADKMHLDLTPALRCLGTIERESYIAHAKGPAPHADDRLVDMNAYGFADWYAWRTPLERRVVEAFAGRWRERETAKADAEADDVPEQTEFVVKNTATLALQLLKRFRNIVYAESTERIPPSVMLSTYAGRAAQPNMRLCDMVLRIAGWIVKDIAAASLRRELLYVANPVCEADVFTDRWPASIAQQNAFADHLKRLIQGLEAIRSQRLGADQIGEWLREQFGAGVVTRAADRMAGDVGRAIREASQSYSRRGRLLVPTAGVAAAGVPALVNTQAVARPHTFYGSKLDGRQTT